MIYGGRPNVTLKVGFVICVEDITGLCPQMLVSVL